MYEQHFGFSRPLFADTAVQGDAIFTTDCMKSLMRDLEVALARKNSVAVLTGASGTGKTTAALHGLKEISTKLAFACVSHTLQSDAELLEFLVTEFSCEPAGLSRIERLQTWRQFLAEMAATNTRVCLLVENADRLAPDVMQAMHALTCADASLTPGANIVLTSVQPPYLLSIPELAAFKQRVRLNYRMLPLNAAETRDYLAFKCRYGGREPTDIFAPDAAAAIYKFSGGILRVVDNLLESVLIAAATDAQTNVDGSFVASVAGNRYGISQLEPDTVSKLLAESTPIDLADAAAASLPDRDGIPILTEYVVAEGDHDVRPEAVRRAHAS
jgi:general secretion pathway protein A